MKRALCAASVVFLLSAVPASADTITFTIGELQWDDPFGIGPDLTIRSYSDNPLFSTDPIPSDFVGGAFADLVWDFSFVDAGSNAVFGTSPSQLDAGAVAFFGTDPLNQLTLSFSFLYSLAGAPMVQAYSFVVSAPPFDEFNEQHGSRLIDFSLTTETTSVPEPGSLTLLLTGLALVTGRARRRKP